MSLLPAWSRRAFLATGSATALGLALAPAARAAQDEFETLRLRWNDLSLGTGYDPAAEPYAAKLAETGELAAEFRSTMAPAAASLWAGHTFDPPAGITWSYSRLWTMTQAYAQQGTGHTGDEGLLADIVRGLDHLYATVYNPSTARYGNWWEWQIGSPRLLMDIVAVLHPHLGEERVVAACAAVDHFIPDSMLTDYSGTSTGANRVDLCRSVALRGILGRDAARTALARDALSPVFPYVTKGDGLYADGSFVQHTWVAYSGTYGQVMLDGLGRLFALLAGSTWAVTDPNRQIILDSVEHAYAPLIHDGLMMDSVNGRAISRGLLKSDERRIMRSDHFHGQGLIAAVALLAGGASAAERDRWNGMVKGWIERDTVSPVLAAPQFGVADLSRLHAAAAAPSRPRPSPSATPSSRRWTGPCTAAPAGSRTSPWHRSGSVRTSAATARIRAAGTPGPECSTGGRARTAAASTPTGSGPPSTGTGCPAPPSPPSGSPTGPVANGASPARPCSGSAGRTTASSPPSDSM